MASRQQPSQITQPMGAAAQGRQVAEPIVASEEYMRLLTKLIPSTKELIKGGFVLSPLTPSELQAKVKCQKCNKKCKKDDRLPKPSAQVGEGSGNGASASTSTNGANGAAAATNGAATTNDGSGNTRHDRRNRYRSHGKPNQQDKGKQIDAANGEQPKIWTCCSKHVSQPPCSGAPAHTPTTYPPGVLEKRWRFVPTPSTPPSSSPSHCEMGLTTTLDSELIRLSLIDFFTGQILLDSLVLPTVPMQHMNTKYSGVTRSDLTNAVATKTCIMGGFEAARREVWKFVGPDTVVVGHSVGNDLGVLRMIHPRVVDSLIIEEGVRREKKEEEEREVKRKMGEMFERGMGVEEVMKWVEEQKEEEERKRKTKRPEDGMSLKALAKKKLGRTIQDGGKRGHDSVEDAVAARDLVDLVVEGMMREDKVERERKEAEEKKAKKEAEEKAKKEAEEKAKQAAATPANASGGPGPGTQGVGDFEMRREGEEREAKKKTAKKAEEGRPPQRRLREMASSLC
ncbi:hypothetical protein B0T20DRAFT_491872 [Sordaria brevicollis]|uniref:Exonuclease domain-containing protein n=1 Tax=Sordaria brevicollis TaxID=83679 RepID=A0AAE0UEN3_SORBR|nr:hypothetical protein B0T20DRAFT_491872 [Sordaria brevicollis]